MFAARVLTLTPDAWRPCADVTTLCNLGSLLYDCKKDFAGAQQAFEHVLELEPERGDVMSNLALVFSMQGKLRQAEAMYRGAIERAVRATHTRSPSRRPRTPPSRS